MRQLLLACPLLLAASACRVHTVEYRDRPVYSPNPVAAGCDPQYGACANSYYWDEWREVYVFYDGYSYYDATGLPGAYPLPPQSQPCYGVPVGYIPPSNYRPPYGTYRPPRGYVRTNRPPPPEHSAHAVNPPGGYNGGGYNNNRPPPPPGGSSGTVNPPPRPPGYANNNPSPPPPPPASGGFFNPQPTPSGPPSGNYQPGVSNQPPQRIDDINGPRNTYVPPPPSQPSTVTPSGGRLDDSGPRNTYVPPGSSTSPSAPPPPTGRISDGSGPRNTYQPPPPSQPAQPSSPNMPSTYGGGRIDSTPNTGGFGGRVQQQPQSPPVQAQPQPPPQRIDARPQTQGDQIRGWNRGPNDLPTRPQTQAPQGSSVQGLPSRPNPAPAPPAPGSSPAPSPSPTNSGPRKASPIMRK